MGGSPCLSTPSFLSPPLSITPSPPPSLPYPLKFPLPLMLHSHHDSQPPFFLSQRVSPFLSLPFFSLFLPPHLPTNMSYFLLCIFLRVTMKDKELSCFPFFYVVLANSSLRRFQQCLYSSFRRFNCEKKVVTYINILYIMHFIFSYLFFTYYGRFDHNNTDSQET